jgi:uncharacterized OB-fold protein
MTAERTENKSIWMKYQWSTGDAIGRFLAGLEDRQILAAVCPDCDDRIVPARSFCRNCHVGTDGFEPVSDVGQISTHTVVEVENEPAPADPPYVIAVINLEGADTGMVHIIDSGSPGEIESGDDVEACWKSPSNREGRITDIEHFSEVGSNE